MRILLVLLLFIQVSALSQHKIKKVLIEGTGLPVVMLAGGTADISVYAFHSKELSGSYKIIRMEHFNVQYASEGLWLPNNYSVRMESEAVKSTLDSLNIREPVSIVGHSYGGIIAMDFALNYPNRIRSLVLMEPPAFGIAKAKNESPEGMKKMQELLKELTPDAEITEEQVERFRCTLLNCDSISIRQHPQWTTWLKQKNRLRGLSVIGKYLINFKKLYQFKQPVLIITGTQTVAFHKRINELLTAAFPFARKVSVQSDHAIPATAPRELVKYLLEFLK
ncbi:MAG: alpha/beta hydrolase [Bacteroidota bacterium]|nr:alpha/beta hydrolase [Bacteroidota bacterium]